MYNAWLEASKRSKDNNQDIWAVDFTAHPLLDPDFAKRRSRLLELVRMTYRRIQQDNDAYRSELSRLFFPIGSAQSLDLPLAALLARATEYLREANVYLESTIDLLPEACRDSVRPHEQVAECNDMRDLLGLSFVGPNERACYEARRKLCLAQMLLQIEQSRLIQDGPRHLELFEDFLTDGLWKHIQQSHSLSIGYRMSDDGSNIQYTSRPAESDQRWHFQSTFVEKQHGQRNIALDILYYNCRFKRSVNPISFEIVDGQHRVIEPPRWDGMRQRSSGSILSKMIRKGINHPDEIGDIIGAMFIVHDNDALNDLLVLLDSCIGTPFGWRNVTDTLASSDDGLELNAFSSRQFKVFKGDLDILVPGTRSRVDGVDLPFRFPVEIQIFTLEAYLRTVCGTHEASHSALKTRQFLFGLVPRVFPRDIFGDKWLLLGDDGTVTASK